ncbi:preprotein translocase subunit SecG [Chitinimonas arctica]|uniref:Protein-export membrane protein SecG n=1 Tax=Chitinimonas arctica TaxID=2594795 RepID=A0A516SHL5_9NEIS|nr:preprotein translocase subunit SecG [Chitinimonas arctica]QDQ27647.1 preprotein translocase subunit SecG [Chitinimonas arctica]
MEAIKSLIQVFNVLSALAIIVLVLLQHGKGADMGAAFGSGSSGSLFGATGSANFMSRATAVCAIIFFLSLIFLVKLGAGSAGTQDVGVMSGVVQSAPAKQAAPVKPVQDDKQSSIPN